MVLYKVVTALAGQVLLNDDDGQVISILASEINTCWAVNLSSDDTAGDSSAGSGTRRSAPSIPIYLASWGIYVSVRNASV